MHYKYVNFQISITVASEAVQFLYNSLAINWSRAKYAAVVSLRTELRFTNKFAQRLGKKRGNNSIH